MLKKLSARRATSVIEYVIIIVILMYAFLAAQKYIVRAMAGRWKAAGDTFGMERQFNLSNTVECGYLATDHIPRGYVWYEKKCYRACQDNVNYVACHANCFKGCDDDNNVGPCDAGVDRTQCVSCCTNYCEKEYTDFCACQCDNISGCDENVC